MSTTNPQEEITKLEQQLKKTQDDYLYAENQMKSATQTMDNCKNTIIAIQAAIDTHKKYIPKQEITSGQPASWSEAG
jgi:lipid II:glycine glycyltransferase (peptidoglycan interpeptide bridge formation enzyme)